MRVIADSPAKAKMFGFKSEGIRHQNITKGRRQRAEGRRLRANS
jgi:hypothetical protein